jgi:hypothetical protein
MATLSLLVLLLLQVGLAPLLTGKEVRLAAAILGALRLKEGLVLAVVSDAKRVSTVLQVPSSCRTADFYEQSLIFMCC